MVVSVSWIVTCARVDRAQPADSESARRAPRRTRSQSPASRSGASRLGKQPRQPRAAPAPEHAPFIWVRVYQCARSCARECWLMCACVCVFLCKGAPNPYSHIQWGVNLQACGNASRSQASPSLCMHGHIMPAHVCRMLRAREHQRAAICPTRGHRGSAIYIRTPYQPTSARGSGGVNAHVRSAPAHLSEEHHAGPVPVAVLPVAPVNPTPPRCCEG